jgi:uncharacterized DUF497 family protein
MINVIWDLDDDPGGNVEKVRQHGLTKEDVESALLDPVERGVSRSSGRSLVRGFALDDRSIIVIFEEVDEMTVYPVTAFEA